MKTGPIILIVLGVILTLALFFAPVSPKQDTLVNEALATEEAKEDHRGHSHSNDDQIDPNSEAVNAQVDSLLEKMRSQELPPMQAVLAIRDIAEKHPTNLKANFTLGLMSIQTGQFEKAVERFKTVLEVDPENSEAFRLLAQSYANLGDLKSAEQNYRKALEFAAEQDKAGLEAELEKLNSNK